MEEQSKLLPETVKAIESLKKELNVYLDYVLTKESDQEVALMLDYLDTKKVFYERGKEIKNNLVKDYLKKLV